MFYRVLRYTAMYVAISCLFPGCVFDEYACGDELDGPIPVVIRIRASGQDLTPASRAYNDRSSGEGTVGQLRVIVYRQAGSAWLFETQKFIGNFTPELQEEGVKVYCTSGAKRIFLIANEDKASLCLAGNGGVPSEYRFPSGHIAYDVLNRVMIDRFSYVSPSFAGPGSSIQDMLPMVAVKDIDIPDHLTQQEYDNSYNPDVFELQRCVGKITVRVGMDPEKGVLGEGQAIRLVYVSIGNCPERQYLVEQRDVSGRVLLPDAVDYGFYMSYVPDNPIDLTSSRIDYYGAGTSGKDVLTGHFYLHENPYGRRADSVHKDYGGTPPGYEYGGNDDEDHIEENGYTGSACRISIYYEYEDSREGSLTKYRKSIVHEIPYLPRNSELILNCGILSPGSNESFELKVFEAQWDNKTERVPDYE